MVKTLIRVSHNPLARFRLLWFTAAWILAGVLFILGGMYLFGGIQVASSAEPYIVVQRYLPGGMRTHGAVMLALSLVLAYGLLGPAYGLPELRGHLRKVLLAVCVYSAWLVVAFSGAYLLRTSPDTTFFQAVNIAAVVWWAAGAIWAGLLVMLPPPTSSEHNTWMRGVAATGQSQGV